MAALDSFRGAALTKSPYELAKENEDRYTWLRDRFFVKTYLGWACNLGLLHGVPENESFEQALDRARGV